MAILTITQKMLVDSVLPLIKKRGKVYRKHRPVHVRAATLGQRVVTMTSDGVETVNIAKANDYIVRNLTQAREQYIISAEALKKRYQRIKPLEDGWTLYEPLGSVLGIEISEEVLPGFNHYQEVVMMAPWGSEQSIKQGDQLVSPQPALNEVYRIARKEFEETYVLTTIKEE